MKKKGFSFERRLVSKDSSPSLGRARAVMVIVFLVNNQWPLKGTRGRRQLTTSKNALGSSQFWIGRLKVGGTYISDESSGTELV
jgi:hypothetical protein